jgi:hypothetical protein
MTNSKEAVRAAKGIGLGLVLGLALWLLSKVRTAN